MLQFRGLYKIHFFLMKLYIYQKYFFLFIIFIVIPLYSNAQISKNENSTADSLNDYDIIYEIDTVHITKTLMTHDTIFQVEKKERKKDTLIQIAEKLDSIINPDNKKNIKIEKKHSITIQFSAFNFTNNLSASNTNSNTIVDYRKNYEKPQPSFSFAILPEYKFNKWSITLGLQYSQLKNKYSYPYQSNKQFTYYKDTTYLQLQQYVIDSYYQVTGHDTTWTTIYGHHWVTVNDSIAKTNSVKENQIKKGIQYCGFFEIPLIFGYELLHYKKLCLEARTGIITSYLFYRKGEIVSNENTQTFINLSAYPFVHLTFSGYIGFEVNYKINKKMNIEIIPYYQEAYTSLLQKKSSITQNVNSKGISIGLKYNFNK